MHPHATVPHMQGTMPGGHPTGPGVSAQSLLTNKRSMRQAPPNDARAWGETAHIVEGVHKQIHIKPVTVGSFGAAVVVPYIIFGMVGIAFMFVYHHHFEILSAVLAALAMVFAFVGMALRQVSRGTMSYIFFLCFLSIVTGSVSGYYNYVHIILPFWGYYEHRRYTNVMPDELASAHIDASAIVFAEGTRPDVTRPVGYVAGQHTYCVAPITMRGVELSTSDIQYWAAGKDCCRQRSDFRCGDAANRHAHAGIVKQMTPHFIDVERWRDLDYYREAVAMASASYGITSAETVIFLNWVSDIEHGLGDIFAYSWLFWIESMIAYLIISIIIGLGLHGAK